MKRKGYFPVDLSSSPYVKHFIKLFISAGYVLIDKIVQCKQFLEVCAIEMYSNCYESYAFVKAKVIVRPLRRLQTKSNVFGVSLKIEQKDKILLANSPYLTVEQQGQTLLSTLKRQCYLMETAAEPESVWIRITFCTTHLYKFGNFTQFY